MSTDEKIERASVHAQHIGPVDRELSASEALWQLVEATRAARNITQKVLACEAGIPRSAVTRLKQGHDLSLRTANQLFAWLGDPREAKCHHDWRFAHVIGRLAADAEVYYCRYCLERRQLETAR